MDHALFKITDSAGVRQVPFISTRVTMGRHRTNNIFLIDALASRFHCVVEKTADGFLLRDLQSSNGTFVNGQRVINSPLANGDVITIGSTHILFTAQSRPGPQSHSAPRKPAAAPPAPANAVAALEALAGKSDASEAAADSDTPLDELEVVDDEESIEMVGSEFDSPADIFRRIADNIPTKDFDIDEIELINTRGKPIMEDAEKSTNRGENVNLFRTILLICFRSNASDIHLEARADDFLMRIRVDGALIDLTRLSREIGTKISAIVKLLADLDTTQKTIVQEGHFAARAPQPAAAGQPSNAAKTRRVDYRVSFVPTLYGQKLVIRIFDTASAPALVNDLQLPVAMSAEVNRQLGMGSNIILVCGPTGSGKTTTLYALLRSCGVSHRNILTIEDPVEVQIEGATQLPVDDANGKSFAALLRSSLRQDPDVIMVGEIRDAETAKIALQAAITGHLVFSSVHTRDTIGTIFRLLDLGCEPFMVAQGLHLIIAQRLVRKLCLACRRPYSPSPDDRAKLGPAGESIRTLFAPTGCPKCLNSGFAGRRAVFELLTVNDKLRDCIAHKPTHSEIHAILAEQSFIPIVQAGYQLVAEGITSFDEIDRAVGQ